MPGQVFRAIDAVLITFWIFCTLSMVSKAMMQIIIKHCSHFIDDDKERFGIVCKLNHLVSKIVGYELQSLCVQNLDLSTLPSNICSKLTD